MKSEGDSFFQSKLTDPLKSIETLYPDYEFLRVHCWIYLVTSASSTELDTQEGLNTLFVKINKFSTLCQVLQTDAEALAL